MTTNDFWVSFLLDPVAWIINDTPGQVSGNYWYLIPGGPNGTYTGNGDNTGKPICHKFVDEPVQGFQGPGTQSEPVILGDDPRG